MKSIIILAILLINCLSNQLITLPLWPLHFSQSFEVETSTAVIMGRAWYDFKNNKFRYDVQYPQLHYCQYYSSYTTACRQLIIENKIYSILPQKQMCCYENILTSSLSRDWLIKQKYKYEGEFIIDGKLYDRWKSNSNGFMEYYTDKSEKKIPRRQIKDNIIFDYDVDSYDQNSIDQQVFKVPDYCQHQCSQKQDNQLHKTNKMSYDKQRSQNDIEVDI